MPKGVKWKSVKKKKAIRIPQITTIEQADEHQRRHGFKPVIKQLQKTVDTVSAKLRGKAREMNKTEREFSVLLEARKRDGNLKEWKYEGVRLLWGDCMVYTADFSALRPDGFVELHEIKGPFIRDRDIVRFKGCRAEWKEWFCFEMHQRTKEGQWNRLL